MTIEAKIIKVELVGNARRITVDKMEPWLYMVVNCKEFELGDHVKVTVEKAK